MEPTLQEQLSIVLNVASLRAGARALYDEAERGDEIAEGYGRQLDRAADILYEIVESEDE